MISVTDMGEKHNVSFEKITQSIKFSSDSYSLSIADTTKQTANIAEEISHNIEFPVSLQTQSTVTKMLARENKCETKFFK